MNSYKTMMAINGLESLIQEPTRIIEQFETCIYHAYMRVCSKSNITADASVIQADITDHSHGLGERAGEGAASLCCPRPLLH
ncbi:hypothetical protein J6590_082915 [Homalodisca vitripennis]|nr:hypothetical protein J6590_082915 [Homalodisca vitripennis]